MFSNLLIIDILDYIDNNLYTKITINSLENKFNYNKDYIMRLFKREIGITIIDYINKKRIYNSLTSLKDSNDSIILISINYGYYSLEYYSEIFKSIIGVSPSIYRKFSRFDHNISISNSDKIRRSIIELDYLFNKINKYKNNVMPKSTVKSLFIITK